MGMSSSGIAEDLKVPPRILHIFTKMDVAIKPEYQAVLDHNEELIKKMVGEKFVDQRIFVSCKPERQEINLAEQDDKLGIEKPVSKHEKRRVVYQGLEALK